MSEPTRIEPARWQCPNCVAQPLLGLYTSAGLHIRAGGRRQHAPTHYVVNFETGSVLAHCFTCHSWRALRYDRRARRVIEQAYTGPRPIVGCACEEGSVARQQQPQEQLEPGYQPAPPPVRLPQPEELPWLDPNSAEAACTVCGKNYGSFVEDPYTRARRHVQCSPRQTVIDADGETREVPSERPALTGTPRTFERAKPPDVE